jgi:hypothetical protein
MLRGVAIPARPTEDAEHLAMQARHAVRAGIEHKSDGAFLR